MKSTPPMVFPSENTVKVQSASEGCVGKEPVGDFPCLTKEGFVSFVGFVIIKKEWQSLRHG